MKIFRIVLLVFLFASCKKETDIQYDKFGNVYSKSYKRKKVGGIDSVVYFANNIPTQKIIYKNISKDKRFVQVYDKNRLAGEGHMIGRIKTGKWKFYKNYKLFKAVEFKNICGEEYANQEWNYDNFGKVSRNSSYYTYEFSNRELKSGTENLLTIKYIPVNNGSVCTLNLSQDLDSTFCNADKVEKFKLASEAPFLFKVPLKIEVKGKTNFKGYLEEYVFDKPDSEGKSGYKTRRLYIDIPAEVK